MPAGRQCPPSLHDQLSRFTWIEQTPAGPVTQKIFWPWFTLIGTTVTIAVASALRVLLGDRTKPAG